MMDHSSNSFSIKNSSIKLISILNISRENKALYIPIAYVQLYLTATILLYILGPLEWKSQNPVMLFSFILLSQALLFFGYMLEMNKMTKRNTVNNHVDNYVQLDSKEKTLKFLNIFIVINLIITILYLMRNTGMSSFSLAEIISNFSKGLTDSGNQYLGKFNEEISFGGGWLAPLITISSPLLWPVIPLSFYFFKDLKFYNKLIIILTVFFEAARWISTGTNKGVIDLILTFVFIVFIRLWNKNYLANEKKSKKQIVYIAAILSLILLGFTLFVNNIDSRLNENYNTVTKITGDTKVNLDKPLMKLMPDELNSLFVYTSQYLTQGYYGLSLALDEPFVPMFGVGNSTFILENLKEINIDLYQYTYAERIAYEGWDPSMNWHTIYVWLANDLSFFGVLVAMYFIGVYFAHVSYRCIANKEPIAISLLILLLLGFFYFPANNQIMASPITFMAFWGINAYWIFKAKNNGVLKKYE